VGEARRHAAQLAAGATEEEGAVSTLSRLSQLSVIVASASDNWAL
jgi:hypothetical protein